MDADHHEDGEPAILSLDQRKAEALVMRCANEDIRIVKQLLDALAWLIAMQRHAGKALERPPVIAPTLPSDDIQCRARKTLCAQRLGYPCRRVEIFPRLHGSKRHEPHRLRLGFGAFL